MADRLRLVVNEDREFPAVTGLQAAVAAKAARADLERRLGLLAAEVHAHYEAGTPQSPAFMSAALAALMDIPHDELARDRAAALIEAAHFFYLRGDSLRVIEPARAAVHLARAAAPLPLLRKALTLLGMAHADIHDFSSATVCYDEAQQVAYEAQDRAGECAVWVNYGVAMGYAGQYVNAIACFEHVLELVGKRPELAYYRLFALSNISLGCLHLEEPVRGLSAIQAAIEEAGEPKTSADFVSRSLRENYYARLLLAVGRVKDAGERCSLAEPYARRSDSHRAKVAVAIARGLYEVHAGRGELGVDLLERTLEDARRFKVMLHDTLHALADAAELRNRPDDALQHLRELVDLMCENQRANAQVLNRLPDRAAVSDGQIYQTKLMGRLSDQEVNLDRVVMLDHMAVTAGFHDDATGRHVYRIGKLSRLLAVELGAEAELCSACELAGRWHDIGQIVIPPSILTKTTGHSVAEINLFQSHAKRGNDLLKNIGIPYDDVVRGVVLGHHERWDGGGYPERLAGDRIPWAARVVALVEYFDSHTHERPGRAAEPVDVILDRIKAESGHMFDPKMVDAFVALVARLQGEHEDLDAFLGLDARRSAFLKARTRMQSEINRPKPRH